MAGWAQHAAPPYAAPPRQSLPAATYIHVTETPQMCSAPAFPPVSQHQRLQRSAAYFERSIMDLVHELECGDSPVNSYAWQQSIGSFDRPTVPAAPPSLGRVAARGYARQDQPAVPASGGRWPLCAAARHMVPRQEASQDIIDILTLMRE